jgi:L-fuconolactonase
VILDTHVHLWRMDDGERFPMREKIAALGRDFTEADLARERAGTGVEATVLVCTMNSVADTVGWLRRAERSDQIVGVVGWVDVFDDDLASHVDRLRAFPRFAGLRPQQADVWGQEWLTDRRTPQALAVLDRLGCNLDVMVRIEHLPSAVTLFRDHPTLRLCLNHGGRPAVMSGALEPWWSHVRSFARETRGVVKCSGLIERAGVEWTVASIKPYVAALLETFGAERVMFGSNWPVLEIAGTYRGWVEAACRIIDELGLVQVEKEAVLWRTGARFYGIERRIEPNQGGEHAYSCA